MKVEVVKLRDGYDPSADQGREALELFLHYEKPPQKIFIDRREDKLVAIATWEEPDARRSR